jgi:hypothetical protein
MLCLAKDCHVSRGFRGRLGEFIRRFAFIEAAPIDFARSNNPPAPRVVLLATGRTQILDE